MTTAAPTRLACPRCDRTWRQRGDKSGHCSACHETFYGITAFDAHFARREDGGPLCRRPDVIVKPGPWWQDDDGQWHLGHRMTDEDRRAAGWVK